MAELMFSLNGEKGQWYAVKKGTKVFAVREKEKLPYLTEKENKPKLDPTGKNLAAKP